MKSYNKILVTGGAGFIGTNLIKRLIDDGHEVESLDNYDSGLSENHQENCIYHSGDINTFLDDNLTKKYDYIYHLAGLSRIQPSFDNPSETFRVNTLGTQKVLEYARTHNSKVIYAGSSSKWHNPYQSPYATCKYLGEELCKMYRETYNMNVQIARFYNVYGPYEVIDGDWAAVIGIWRKQIRDGSPITIVGDGEQRRDFTHVDDIVDGLIKISESNIIHDDAWEFGTGKNYSINEVFEMFKSRFPSVEKKIISDQKGNYRETRRENNDAINQLNWSPTDRLEKYILSLQG